MTTLNLSSGEYLLVDVPEDAHNVIVYNGELVDNWADEEMQRLKVLPPGHYTLIGKGSEVSWQDKVGIVEKEHDGSQTMHWWYKNYITDNWTKNIDESFDSLLRSHGKEPGTTVILKRKI